MKYVFSQFEPSCRSFVALWTKPYTFSLFLSLSALRSTVTSASAATRTQPQTSARSSPICLSSQPWTRSRSRLFHFTAATSSLQSPPPIVFCGLSVLLSPTHLHVHSQRQNKGFFCVCVCLSVLIYVKGRSRRCWWCRRGRESRLCTKAVSFLHKSLKGVSAHASPSVYRSFLFSHMDKLSNLVSRENQYHMLQFFPLRKHAIQIPANLQGFIDK